MPHLHTEIPLAGLDPVRLSKTLAHLLRAPASPGLAPDADGWFAVEQVARAVSRTIHRHVRAEDVTRAVNRHGGSRLEMESGRIRANARGSFAVEHPPGPDLLFHATTREQQARHRSAGRVTGENGAAVQLSRSETHAWRVAHRAWVDPVVLYIDAARARRDGVTIERARSGLYSARDIPTRYVLNLRDGFAEQASAGGFLVDWHGDVPRIALIRVSRRSGTTWEVAKGKLEAGESPPATAVREVREEMGVDVPLVASRALGTVRYGFYTREGTPRLKTIYLYLLEAQAPIARFTPASGEGIDAVRWFDVEAAIAALAHPSLRGSIGRLVQALGERAAELGVHMPKSA